MPAKKKHWFKAKAADAKKKYLKKHPRSIYASARGVAPQSYHVQLQHMREEIKRIKEQLEKIEDHTSSQYNMMHNRLRLMQQKLARFKNQYA